jgi:hypothetical protein
MARANVEVVRALWAGLRQDPGEPWPPASRDELDRRLRLDLCPERIEIRNPPEVPVADETEVDGQRPTSYCGAI